MNLTNEHRLALAKALQDYKPWHNPTAHNYMGNDPLKLILTKAFEMGITTPQALAEGSKVSIFDIDLCVNKGIVPSRKDRKHLSKALGHMVHDPALIASMDMASPS